MLEVYEKKKIGAAPTNEDSPEVTRRPRVVQDTLSEIKIRQADVDQKIIGIVEGS